MNLFNYLFSLCCVLMYPTGENGYLKAFKINGFAQGTTYSITYYSDSELVTKPQIDSVLAVIDHSMSLYQSGSIINQFNESTGGMLVDFHFMEVFKKAKAINRDTKGKFDATVAPLVQLWGFGPKKIDKLPDSDEIKQALKSVGQRKIHAKGLYLKKKLPGLHLDFNGIAQGYTVDVIAKFLRQARIQDFLVEVGGELVVNGEKPNGEAFKVGIEGPTESNSPESRIKHILQLKSGAVTTSGNYQKYIQTGNKQVSHLIDPVSGYPYSNEMVSATVYAKDAITADGYDNVMMAMGVKEALAFVAKRKDLAVYLIYKDKDGELRDTVSTGFKKLIIN